MMHSIPLKGPGYKSEGRRFESCERTMCAATRANVLKCWEKAPRPKYEDLQVIYNIGKSLESYLQRLLISRFQVRVLGGSLEKSLQIVGNARSSGVALEFFDTSLTLTGSSSRRRTGKWASHPRNRHSSRTGATVSAASAVGRGLPRRPRLRRRPPLARLPVPGAATRRSPKTPARPTLPSRVTSRAFTTSPA